MDSDGVVNHRLDGLVHGHQELLVQFQGLHQSIRVLIKIHSVTVFFLVVMVKLILRIIIGAAL